jgi:calcium-dependent protein kinase
VTQDAKDLIRELIKMDPKQRLTAEQALNHAWIKDKAPKADFNNLLQDGFVEHLRDFQSANYLKKAALHIIAGQLSEQQIKSLRETFVALDENEDGLLTVAEIRVGLTKTGLDEIPVDLQQIVAEVDADGNGLIDYTEFLAATLQKKLYIQEELCWKAFSIFDQNGDGQISREELKQVLNSGEIEDEVGTERIDLLMQEVDANGDGMIDFDEFMAMMQTHGSPCHQP